MAININKKQIRKKIYIFITAILICSTLLGNRIVYADLVISAEGDYFDTVEPGTVFVIPDDVDQIGATVETYHNERNPASEPGRESYYGTRQYDVRKLWESQGEPYIAEADVAEADKANTPYNIAYVEIAGTRRFIIALAGTFGQAGDFIDITLKSGEKIPCIMGDEKGSDNQYIYNGSDPAYQGKHLGHHPENRRY